MNKKGFLVRLSNFSEFKYWPQIAVVVLLLAGFGAYRYFAYYDTRSNDAYVSANIVNMAALVSGPITHVYVRENQQVKKGTSLLKLIHYLMFMRWIGLKPD